MKRATSKPLVELSIRTTDGQFTAQYSEAGLAELAFPARRAAQLELNIAPPAIARWHRATTAALKLALAGRTPRVLPPLDLNAATVFQQSVWRALLKIPRGETRSYGEIARIIHNPRATRAVGSACSANPIPILIPCHRVLAKGHQLAGYSGGLEWKRKLLWREESRDWWESPVRKPSNPA